MSAAPAPKIRSPSIARRSVLGAHRVEVPDERDVRPPARVAAHERHDDRVAVATDRRRERQAREPLRDGVAERLLLADRRRDRAEPEQRLLERDRRRRRVVERLRRSTSRHLGSHRDREVAERVVEADLAIGARGALADDERAGHAELAGGELLRARAGDDDRARRDAAAVLDDLGPADVEDRRRRREHDAGADDRLLADVHALDDDRARADERAVLDDDRARARRLEHAADADAAGEVARPCRSARRSRPWPTCRPSCPRRRTRRCSRSRASRSTPGSQNAP